jgi:hypothetical protein
MNESCTALVGTRMCPLKKKKEEGGAKFKCNYSGLCARSWLARHPAKIEITGSSGGSSHHTKIFFFCCKNHDFSRFIINF